MKNLFIALILGFCLPAAAQTASRYDNFTFTTGSTVTGNSNPPVLAIPAATIAWCSAPANGVPCTNYATTYTDSTAGTSCASNVPLTRPGQNICIANSDSQGNFGFWIEAGHYQYTIVPTYSNFGPFDITVSSATGGAT